ncbi:hypothetical protein DICVIV_08502 [Dictyocaulus viviparus]|uniref:Uncharacterized protein n=1 Tax=Dictyocaulus viviparus TaxID=29172 RepID=A0A0D8XLF4_DICVI|nr:hypothetical protein DICVIV_08502 [Dictyocaulus viviparus]
MRNNQFKISGIAPFVPPVGVQPRLRPPDDNETINEVISNWGAAQAMVKKQAEAKIILVRNQFLNYPTVFETVKAIGHCSCSTSRPACGNSTLRPPDDNETINEVVSNWGAAQAMVKKQTGAPNPSAPVVPPVGVKPKLRPQDDNETINEVVSNWGAAQAMVQKRAPARKPIERQRTSHGNDTFNDVVSDWNPGQTMIQKKDADQVRPPHQKTTTVEPTAQKDKFRKANDNETIDECVSDWGAVQVMKKKKVFKERKEKKNG